MSLRGTDITKPWLETFADPPVTSQRNVSACGQSAATLVRSACEACRAIGTTSSSILKWLLIVCQMRRYVDATVAPPNAVPFYPPPPIFNSLHSEMNVFTPGESDAQLQKPSNGRSPPGQRHLSSDLFDEPHEAKAKKKKKKKDFCAAAARLPPLGSNRSEIKEREDGSESAAPL